MENGNNNYSFTPIAEDNSVNEIKDDFFGGSSVSESDAVKEEVPPILEVPKIENEVKEEAITPMVEENVVTETNAEEPKVEEKPVEPVENSNNENIAVAPEQVETPALEGPAVTNAEEEKQETSSEIISENSSAIQEVTTPVENESSEPVEVKIPEGLDEEEPVANMETPIENNPAPEAPEEPKKGRSIFDFFKVKDAPTVEATESDSNKEEIASKVEESSLPSIEEPKVEVTSTPVVDEVKPEENTAVEVTIPEVNISNLEVENTEEPVVETTNENNNELTGEIPLFNLDNELSEEPKEEEVTEQPSVPEPVIESVHEDTPVPDFNSLENREEKTFEIDEPVVPEEPPKEVEPIVKEVVVEKEKVILGKKCPNCGEITAETFCPNCGFLVE